MKREARRNQKDETRKKRDKRRKKKAERKKQEERGKKEGEEKHKFHVKERIRDSHYKWSSFCRLIKSVQFLGCGEKKQPG